MIVSPAGVAVDCTGDTVAAFAMATKHPKTPNPSPNNNRGSCNFMDVASFEIQEISRRTIRGSV
jgi:hypothetical protein